MSAPRRPRGVSSRPGAPTPRSARYWLVSFGTHIVLGALLIVVLSIPGTFSRDFRSQKPESLPVERIGFLSVPNRGAETPGRSGGDGRPVRAPVPERRLVAPTSVPSTLPPVEPAAPVPTPVPAGSGPVVGTGGATAGITPSFSDPRVWRNPDDIVVAPRSAAVTPFAQRVEMTMRAAIEAHNDSMAIAAANAPRKAGDWTTERNGKKYGIDQQSIYIGDVKIPTAILALLPINQQSNPIAADRARQMQWVHDDIALHAQQALTEGEFREAVRRIRDRRAREAKAKAEQRPPAQVP